MGPAGCNEKKIELIKNNMGVDLDDFDIQPVDDGISPFNVDEFFPFEEAFETQVVDLDHETQVAELCTETQLADLDGYAQVEDLCGETQQVDLAGYTQVDELCGETQQVDLVGYSQVDELCFETQQVDLGGHTQVVELCGQIEPVDLGGETQVLDDSKTDIPAVNDDEGGTDIEEFCDTQVISIQDSAQRNGNCLADPLNMKSTGLNEESGRDSRAASDALSNEVHRSGSVLRGFTSIRAASIRASGLAARNIALKRIKSSCSASDNSLELQNAEDDGILVSRYSLKSGSEYNFPGCQRNNMVDSRELLELENECEQSDQRHTQLENGQHIESRSAYSRKFGSSTARKLFMDDSASDIRQMDDGINNADNIDLPLVFASESGLGGLSYVDSQEPGDLSQANALEVVDKIVTLNMMDNVEKVFFKESTDGKSKSISSAKGTLSLAKKTATRMSEAENRAFIWDDNLEDEGGGDFFQRNKELFFDSKKSKSLKLPSRKSWSQNSKSGTRPQENGDEEHLNKSKKSKDAVSSDSRRLSKSLSLNDEPREESFRKNLMKKLDEEMNAASGDMKADGSNDKDAPDVVDVGLDTQIAADAMETLRFAASVADNDKSPCGEAGSTSNLKQNLHRKEACSFGAGVITRQCKRARTVVESDREFSVPSSKLSKNSKKKLDPQLGEREPNRSKLDQKAFLENTGGKNLSSVSKKVVRTRKNKIDRTCTSISGGPKSLNSLPLQDQNDSFVPVAHRTRQSMPVNNLQCGNNLKRSREHVDVTGHVYQRRRRGTKVYISETSEDKADPAGKFKNIDAKLPNLVEHPRGRRTRSRSALVGQEETTEFNKRSKLSKVDILSSSTTDTNLKQQLNVCGGRNICASVDRNTCIQEDVVQTKSSKPSSVNTNKDNKTSAEGEKANSSSEASSKDGHKSSALEIATPINCAAPVNDASPICKGDEYLKQSCRKNLLGSSLSREVNSLLSTGLEPASAVKDSRRRRDMASVRVLFSRHLDADIIKQQKKILSRLGALVASSMSDASHFVTDEFTRTRNMLEAIAFGKPVVTHLWLESCGEASCFIDDRSYILRDVKKEKEFGFSMPVSLARASQNPLLKGHRVFITPNTNPGKEILASLVKAVHGLAVERLGRSSLKDENFPDDLLVLSCEEDYDICVPFLEKGASVYSSELLLNGIVTQRLDYERHRLFSDSVKRTRSTIWLKRKDNVYIPVCKGK